jgi:hypothetical protein
MPTCGSDQHPNNQMPSTHSSMEQSSSKGNRPAANQEIHRILWNPKIHYRVRDTPLLLPVLSNVNPLPHQQVE